LFNFSIIIVIVVAIVIIVIMIMVMEPVIMSVLVYMASMMMVPGWGSRWAA